MTIRRALVSVHDKTGVVEFAQALAGLGIELVSTGGTAKLLREAGVPVRDVADVTGFPEMMDGRVKTLHPKIHGGILARRDRADHVAALERHGIPPIDLVVVSLYPFEATVARAGVTLAEAIEQIDVGGPTMIRAAAKNHASVAVVTDPAQYRGVLDELRARAGALSDATRARLAREAFARTAQYDAAIAQYLHAEGASTDFPAMLRLEADRALTLKYGENPHQAAAFYRPLGAPALGLAAMKQLHGPELGYNNLLDFSAALGLLLEFGEPAAVVIKHTNPCGAALGATVGEALARAKACDPVSIYGGIVGVNRPADMAVVQALAGIFVEILFAPAFAPDALAELQRTKKKCRVFEVPCDRASLPRRITEYRSVLGGILAQSGDLTDLSEAGLRTVSRRPPTAEELAALRFAWRVAKHVKSNAIVLATREQVVGVGAGQMNRLDSAGALVALDPALSAYAVKFHPLVLDGLLIALVALTCQSLLADPRRDRALAFGLALGVAVLSRPTVIAFAVAVLLWTAGTRWGRAARRPVALGLAIGALVVAPWVARNWAILGTFVLTRTNTAYVFWLGNNPDAVGGAIRPDDPTGVGSLFDAAPHELRERVLAADELGQNRIFRDEALRYVLADPLAFVGRTVQKLSYFWWFPPYTGRRYPGWQVTGYQVFYSIVLSLALLGLAAAWRRSPTTPGHGLGVLLLLLLGISGAQALFYVDGRHRLGVEALLLVLSGHGAVRLAALAGLTKTRSSEY